MKKLIATSILMSNILFADSQVYMGILGGYITESFSKPQDKSTSSPMAKFQIGYGELKGFAVQLGLIYNPNSKNIFANTAGSKDKEKYSLDVELIKAFDFGIGLYPFLKAGFGAGYFDTDITYTNADGTFTQNKLNFSSYNGGAGFYYPLSEHFVLELGATYKYISYERWDKSSTGEAAVDTHAIYSYGGINYRF